MGKYNCPHCGAKDVGMFGDGCSRDKDISKHIYCNVGDCTIKLYYEGSDGIHKEMIKLKDKFYSDMDHLLEKCKLEDGECSKCSVIICPFGDVLHFHHDGCPTCSQLN